MVIEIKATDTLHPEDVNQEITHLMSIGEYSCFLDVDEYQYYRESLSHDISMDHYFFEIKRLIENSSVIDLYEIERKMFNDYYDFRPDMGRVHFLLNMIGEKIRNDSNYDKVQENIEFEDWR